MRVNLLRNTMFLKEDNVDVYIRKINRPEGNQISH